MAGRCKARRVGDEWHCLACALQWDASDKAPDACEARHEGVKHDPNFMVRVLDALGEASFSVAHNIGVSARDIDDLCKGSRAKVAEYHADPVWPLLKAYVDDRIGKLLAVRDELNMKADKDRARTLARHNRIRDR